MKKKVSQMLLLLKNQEKSLLFLVLLSVIDIISMVLILIGNSQLRVVKMVTVIVQKMVKIMLFYCIAFESI